MLETLRPFSKAVAAAVAGAIVSWLMKQNIVIEDGLHDALEVLISAAIMAAAVYLAPKNTEPRR